MDKVKELEKRIEELERRQWRFEKIEPLIFEDE